MKNRRLVLRSALIALTLALAAASCGGSDDPTADETTTTTAASDAEDATEPGEPEAVELTASYTGVTPEVIKVGILSIDFEALSAAGVGSGRTNVDEIFAAPFEVINENGGIHGRMIEVISIPVLPIGSAAHDAACIELTEDDPVFVVVGSQGTNVECYTELNNTAVVAVSGMTTERRDNAKAPYATIRMTVDRRMELAIESFVEMGVFEGEVVGLSGAAQAGEATFDRIAATLDAHGIDYVSGLVSDNAGDITASQSEGGVIAERFNAAGVTLVINTVSVAVGLEGHASNPDPPKLILLPFIGAQAFAAQGLNLESLDGALSVTETAVGTTGQPAMADDPRIAECVANVERLAGETIEFGLEFDTNLNGAINGCSQAAIVHAAMINAGPNLTNETFEAGLDAIGDIALPGYSGSHISADGHDAAGELTVVRFDAQLRAWVPIG